MYRSLTHVFALDDFATFHSRFPEWCEGEELQSAGHEIVLGLTSLSLSSPASPLPVTSRGDRERCDSLLGTSPSALADRDFPIQILPYLFLGNQQNSADEESLKKHGIKVSP